MFKYYVTSAMFLLIIMLISKPILLKVFITSYLALSALLLVELQRSISPSSGYRPMSFLFVFCGY